MKQITKKIFIYGLIFINSLIYINGQIPDEPMSISNYPGFYTQIIGNFNNIIPNKTYYYGKPLSVFLNALNQNNIVIKSYDPGPFNNKLLTFGFIWNRDVEVGCSDYDYVEPEIQLFFQTPYNYKQISNILSTNGYFSHWNQQAEDFFKNLIVEKIEFWYVSGLTDKTSPPK